MCLSLLEDWLTLAPNGVQHLKSQWEDELLTLKRVSTGSLLSLQDLADRNCLSLRSDRVVATLKASFRSQMAAERRSDCGLDGCARVSEDLVGSLSLPAPARSERSPSLSWCSSRWWRRERVPFFFTCLEKARMTIAEAWFMLLASEATPLAFTGAYGAGDSVQGPPPSQL